MPREWLPPREFRRLLRREQTEAERRLWALLRNRHLGVKFRRQHSLDRYTLDFFSPEVLLALELDGGQHYEEVHAARDLERDALLAARGIEVLRFNDREVLLEREAVAEVILGAVRRRSPPA